MRGSSLVLAWEALLLVCVVAWIWLVWEDFLEVCAAGSGWIWLVAEQQGRRAGQQKHSSAFEVRWFVPAAAAAVIGTSAMCRPSSPDAPGPRSCQAETGSSGLSGWRPRYRLPLASTASAARSSLGL